MRNQIFNKMTSSWENAFAVPHSLKDITADWVAELMYRELKVPRPAKVDGTHNGVTLLQIRAMPGHGFRETAKVTAKCSSQPDVTHRLLVEVIPSDPGPYSTLRQMAFKRDCMSCVVVQI